MFNYVIVKNFRKLRDNRYDFTGGLNVIRGANEQGKTSLLEAVAYAMQGVEALRESLDAVVTWGEKETALKVELGLTINNTDIVVKRSKGGAEVAVGGKLVATGQKEVTRYVEGLMGAAPKIAGKLMMAKQSSLRGALDEGPKATAELIEQLSNFSLIDEVVQLVQENLPCGSPVALEQQAKTLAGQIEASAPGELVLTDQTAALAAAQAAALKEQRQLAEAQAELAPAAKAAAASRERLQRFNAARQAVAAQETLVRESQDSLAKLNPVSSTSEEALAELRRQQAEVAKVLAARQAYAELGRFVYPETVWEGGRASFEQEMAAAVSTINDAGAGLQVALVEAAGLEAQKITGTACGLCGKDLTAIPEVVAKNAGLDTRLKALREEQEQQQRRLQESQGDLKVLRGIDEQDRKLQLLLSKHSTLVRKLDTQVPMAWEWAGPDIVGALPDHTAQIKQAEQEIQRAAQDRGRKSALDASIARASAAATLANNTVVELGPLVSADRSTGLEEDLKTKVNYHEQRVIQLNADAARISAEIKSATDMHALKVRNYEQLQANFAAANKQLEELALNNVLLKKLRAARPKVADKLWGVVLPTIGFYFSKTRGVQSVVSRDEDGFKVDGKPIAGLSGSALDSLGLGIRIALVKTFLPNNDFLVLDEPAAACDDGRETNMLGMLTTAGFPQVLLVTHSQLADSFAAQVITV